MVPFWKEALEMVLDVEPGKPCCLLMPPWTIAEPCRGLVQDPGCIDRRKLGRTALRPSPPTFHPNQSRTRRDGTLSSSSPFRARQKLILCSWKSTSRGISEPVLECSVTRLMSCHVVGRICREWTLQSCTALTVGTYIPRQAVNTRGLTVSLQFPLLFTCFIDGMVPNDLVLGYLCAISLNRPRWGI